jgi:GntR family transcriptional repressor for pyruvate dehydrogenase complex
VSARDDANGGTGPPAALLPLRRGTAADEVTDRLLTAVALGTYLPGERLPVERELCSMLSVSRSTVRQAMARLRAAGVVEVRRGRSGGAYVSSSWTAASAGAVRRTLQPRLSELELLFDLRARVEEMVARAAAERRTARDVRALESAIAAFAAATEPTQEHMCDATLHATVLSATGNALLAQLSRDLLARATVGVPREPYRRDVFARAVQEHTDLVSAVIDGDVERAGIIARRHFGMSAEALREILARGLADSLTDD